jgi:hypothetical protein
MRACFFNPSLPPPYPPNSLARKLTTPPHDITPHSPPPSPPKNKQKPQSTVPQSAGGKEFKPKGWEGWTSESIELHLQTR